MTTSAPLKLWGRISSINVRKVMWTAQYLKLPIERIDAGAAFGVVHTPEFQKMNPNAMIPVLHLRLNMVKSPSGGGVSG